jgi:hypothetical protein
MRSSILPTNSSDPIQTIVPRRYLRVAVCLLCILGALTSFSGVSVEVARSWSPFTQQPRPNNKSPPVSLADSPDYPPDYAEWHEIEEALPQHNINLTFPEGRGGRYVYFSEHVKSTFYPILGLRSFSKTRHLTILPLNSRGVGERSPGAFLPGPAGLPGEKIVRDA